MNVFSIRQALFAIASLLFSIGASSVESCSSTSGNQELLACLERQEKIADTSLNQIYKQILSGLKKDEKDFTEEFPNQSPIKLEQTFISAQRAWLKFRMETCDLESKIMLAGSPYDSWSERHAFTGCLTKLTNARVSQLREFYSAQNYGGRQSQ